MRFVARPIGALVVVVGAEESLHALVRMQHVVIGARRALIVLIVLARWFELRQLGIEFIIGHWRARRRRTVRSVERHTGHTWERRTHHHNRTEDVGPNEGAPGRDRRATWR